MRFGHPVLHWQCLKTQRPPERRRPLVEKLKNGSGLRARASAELADNSAHYEDRSEDSQRDVDWFRNGDNFTAGKLNGSGCKAETGENDAIQEIRGGCDRDIGAGPKINSVVRSTRVSKTCPAVDRQSERARGNRATVEGQKTGRATR